VAHAAKVFHTKYLPTLITHGLTEKIGFHTLVLVQVPNLEKQTAMIAAQQQAAVQLQQQIMIAALTVHFQNGLYGLNSDYPLIKPL